MLPSAAFCGGSGKLIFIRSNWFLSTKPELTPSWRVSMAARFEANAWWPKFHTAIGERRRSSARYELVESPHRWWSMAR